MPNQDSPIKAQKAAPDAQSWLDYQLASRQKAPERIEDAAKFLAGMISISLTIFLKINPEGFKGAEHAVPTLVAVALWLLSLLAAFLVLFPMPYRYAGESSEDIKRMHRQVVNYKYGWLAVSSFFFLIALGLLSYVYLTQP